MWHYYTWIHFPPLQSPPENSNNVLWQCLLIRTQQHSTSIISQVRIFFCSDVFLRPWFYSTRFRTREIISTSPSLNRIWGQSLTLKICNISTQTRFCLTSYELHVIYLFHGTSFAMPQQQWLHYHMFLLAHCTIFRKIFFLKPQTNNLTWVQLTITLQFNFAYSLSSSHNLYCKVRHWFSVFKI